MAGEDQAGPTPQATEHTPEPKTDEQPPSAGFAERGRMRRRARFLRKARELAYRDLGGLVFDLHRFGQRNDPVVLAKLATLGHIDAELRALEQALHEVRPVTVLREVGIGACPRCAALHGNDDRFCPGCGLAFDAKAERPLSTVPVSPAPVSPSVATPSPSPGTAEPPSPGTSEPPAPAPTAPAGALAKAADPATSIFRPFGKDSEKPLQVKPTAAPVAARPGAPGEQEPSSENGKQERAPEDQPTEILRPPARGA